MKFFKRHVEPNKVLIALPEVDVVLQYRKCYICLGKRVSYYFPQGDEWLDIYQDIEGVESIQRPFMLVDQISFWEFLKATGFRGLKRTVDIFLGRNIFYSPPKAKKGDKTEYSNTDDFFACGPEPYKDLKPPVIVADKE